MANPIIVTTSSSDGNILNGAELKRIDEIINFCESYNRECDKFFAEEARIRRLIGLQERRRIPVKYIFSKRQPNYPSTLQINHKSYMSTEKVIKNESIAITSWKASEPTERFSLSSSETSLSNSWSLNRETCIEGNQLKRHEDQTTSSLKAIPKILSTSSESLNAFLLEERLLQAEIEKVLEPIDEGGNTCDLDDELREFQAIEKEVRLTELSKSLLKIQKEIMIRRENRDKSKEVRDTPLDTYSTSLASHPFQEKTTLITKSNGAQDPSIYSVSSVINSTAENKESKALESPKDTKQEEQKIPDKLSICNLIQIVKKIEGAVDENEEHEDVFARPLSVKTNGSLPRRVSLDSGQPRLSLSSTPSPATVGQLMIEGGHHDYEKIRRNVIGYRSFRGNIPFFNQEQLRNATVSTFVQHQHNNVHIINLSPSFLRDNRIFRSFNDTRSSTSSSRSHLDSRNHSHTEQGGLITEMRLLGHDIDRLVVMEKHLSLSCCTASGFIYKLSSKKKWKKKFFLFDRFHKIFYYYKNEEQFKRIKKPEGGVTFDQLKDVMIDKTRSNVITSMASPIVQAPLSSWLLRSFRRPKVKESVESAKKSKSDEKIFNASPNTTQNSYLTRNTLWSSSMKRVKKNNVMSEQGIDSNSCPIPNRSVFIVETTDKKEMMILSSDSFACMRLWIDIIFTGIESYC
jgi:hypothetical protein